MISPGTLREYCKGGAPPQSISTPPITNGDGECLSVGPYHLLPTEPSDWRDRVPSGSRFGMIFFFPVSSSSSCPLLSSPCLRAPTTPFTAPQSRTMRFRFDTHLCAVVSSVIKESRPVRVASCIHSVCAAVVQMCACVRASHMLHYCC